DAPAPHGGGGCDRAPGVEPPMHRTGCQIDGVQSTATASDVHDAGGNGGRGDHVAVSRHAPFHAFEHAASTGIPPDVGRVATKHGRPSPRPRPWCLPGRVLPPVREPERYGVQPTPPPPSLSAPRSTLSHA